MKFKEKLINKLKKIKINSLRNKVWLYLTIFSFAILAFLWFFQIIFLNSYYEWVKSKEITSIANNILNNYKKNESLQDLFDYMTYEQGVCIELIYKNSEIYSSNSMNRGCLGQQVNDITYLKYKNIMINNGEKKTIYKLKNMKLGNKIIMYGIKLDDDYYVIVNASLQPLTSTMNILASQFIYVTFAVFILSFIISYFISKSISSPIIKLNNTAKKMAEGNHNIKFCPDTDINEITSLAETLNNANSELAKTDELRRELMSNVSHDLKTPLTMIKAYAEMVRDLTYNNKEKRNANLNTIIEETDRLNLLVNDILEVSKMQSNVVELELENFDLNELIENVTRRFSYLEDLKQYNIKYNGISKVIINADKKKIEQVIYNLIGNAINYVGNDKEVIINLLDKNNYYQIEVINHGKCIEKNELDLIWDKYYRVDKKHRRNRVGTGLGLSIVKNIFILHNYEYGVKSNKNIGTKFYFKIKKD